METYKIENEFLIVKVAKLGGCLDSVILKSRNEELLWQGDKKSWEGKDLVIFPMIARLKDGYYLDNGQRYDMKLHGIACYSNFEMISNTNSVMIVELKSNEESKKIYPYDFSLKVKYELIKNQLDISYEVENLSDRIMPYSLGGHAGYILDAEETDNICETEGNYITFEKQQLNRFKMSEDDYFVKGIAQYKNTDRLNLKKSLFAHDAVILKNLDKVSLERKNGIKINVKTENFPILAFWSHDTFGNYVCIEPWAGLPDNEPPIREFKDKFMINELEKGQKGYFKIETEFVG